MINARDFFLQSQYLLQISSDIKFQQEQEVYLRSAISRAYYSLYHETCNHLEGTFSREFNEKKKQMGEDTAEMHRALSDILQAIWEMDRTKDNLSPLFGKFRRLRNKADYKIKEQFDTFSTTEKEIQRIQILIDDIKRLKP
jgi:uncharacterized protein (UPF0332 family)